MNEWYAAHGVTLGDRPGRAGQVDPVRPADRRRARSAAGSRSRTSTTRMRSRETTSACSRRSRPAWRRPRERAAVRRDQRLLSETNERAAELAIINGVQHGLAAEARHAVDVRPGRRPDPGDLRRPVVDIARRRAASWSMVRFLYTIERGVRFPEETLPIIGPRQQVHRDSQARWSSTGRRGVRPRARPDARDDIGRAAEVRSSGCRCSSATRSAAIISLQNIDREDAFSDSDVELLTTLAASLSVALENARLIDETRQRARRAGDRQRGRPGRCRASSTSTRSSSSSASRCDRPSTPTSSTSRCTTSPSDQIDFPYYSEDGERRQREPIAIRRGPHLADPDRPRAAAAEPPGRLGRDRRRGRRARRRSRTSACRSWPATTAIGVISVQSTTRGGPLRRVRRPAPVDDRRERRRRRSRTPGSTRRPTAAATRWRSWPRSARRSRRRSTSVACIERIGERVQSLLSADTTAVFLADPDGRHYPGDRSRRRARRARSRRTRSSSGEGIIGDVIRDADGRSSSTTRAATRGRSTSPAPRTTTPEIERLMVAPLTAPGRVTGMMAVVWRIGRRRRSSRPTSTSSSGSRQQASIAIENARLFAEAAGGDRPRPRPRTRRRARSWPR